uniref:Uncharacterized protein n=1 Tax=Ralstonia solanacearum TaxID=305 RepID=A0A0S4U0A4_RALSL|nr:protein of unknown function [Ralstonia solanacearum]
MHYLRRADFDPKPAVDSSTYRAWLCVLAERLLHTTRLDLLV